MAAGYHMPHRDNLTASEKQMTDSIENIFIEISRELSIINRNMSSLFYLVQYNTGLSRMQAQVLTLVIKSPEPLTVAALARVMVHPRQVVQRAANELAAIDLIVMQDNPRHKQARILRATEKGQRIKRIADLSSAEVARSVAKNIDHDSLLKILLNMRYFSEIIQKSVDVQE
jgi:DNA-binding MarR family transcriptional regulator